MNIQTSTYYTILKHMEKLGYFTIDELLNSLKHSNIAKNEVLSAIDDLICTSAICSHFDHFWISPKISSFLQTHMPSNHQ